MEKGWMMKRWSVLFSLMIALLLFDIFLSGLRLAAAPGLLEPGGTIVHLGAAQADPRAAYREPLRHLYAGGRLHRLAPETAISGTALLPGPALPGDLYIPPGEVGADFCASCTRSELAGRQPLSRAYALHPLRVVLFRSSVKVYDEPGEMVAMWEIAEVRQALDGYLLGAVPYDVLTETQLVADLAGYDLLIVPAFRSDARDAVLSALYESGAADAIRDFVAGGGTLYAQGTGLFVAEDAGLLPEGTVDPYTTIELAPADAFANRGRLSVVMPGSPLAYGWLTDSLYILDDPLIYPDDLGEMEVVAELTNVENADVVPAVFRYPYAAGQIVGVVGHPTDPARRGQLPIFMDALLLALSGYADFYGDAIQTFNPAYPPHEFPAYEVVPVSATLRVENLWDAPLAGAVVTETLSPGYLLTGTLSPTPTAVLTDAGGHTLLIWDLGALAPHANLTLTYHAQTDPETLAAGVGTFARGELAYTGLSGERRSVRHRPFVLTARMAARLVGDRDLEADRHYRIPAEGIYLDVALPLENKEETLAASLALTDWVYVLVPIVDYGNQHVILSTNDGETVWMRNEPFLWDESYPAWEGATAPTQTITLDDWRALPDRPQCVFTSTYGIHVDPPLRATPTLTDYGSFITIPAAYSDAITVTADNELLLPCFPLTWDLGDFPGYWYEEPAVRFGVHSREIEDREVVFHGTPREGTLVVPNDAGSVYVMAGTDPVPFREHLDVATPYAAQVPELPSLTWQDVWSRTHTMHLWAVFYDVWDWDSCATCGGRAEQHAGANLTYGLIADLDGDGLFETPVREIPTRLPRTRLQLMGKTYSASFGDPDYTIPPGQNLMSVPIFKGLGVKIRPEHGDWWRSYRSLAPGNSELISVTETLAYDHLLFHQEIPPGSAAAFVVSATVESYDFNREGSFKIHDGARLIYHQMHAGPNRYEVYDGHVHAPEGFSSDGEVTKQGGPTAVSVYSDTLLFVYRAWDPYDPRPFDRFYDPFLKSWGYGDLVWSTYVGGREEKTLFHTTLGPDGKTRVRVSLDNNTGVTLTDVSVGLDLPEGITATLLYTDPASAPEPIWPELAFLNLTEVPDAWRSVWYFHLAVGDVPADLWGRVIEIPVVVSAGGLPAGYDAPPARLALKQPGAATPSYVSGPAHDFTLTDLLPENVVLDAAALVTDPATVDALWLLLDEDAADPSQDRAGEFFATLAPTVTFTLSAAQVTFDLPDALHALPSDAPWYVVARADLVRAEHGPNVVNEGPMIHYTDPFGVVWDEQGPRVTVEAHGAAVWVDYVCDSGWAPSALAPGAANVTGACDIYDVPGEVILDVTAYNAGDAVARTVTVTLELPDGVTVTESTPPWSRIDGPLVTWRLGDLAPGAWKEFEITMWVDPDEGEWYAARPSAQNPVAQMLGVDHADGSFFDDHSQRFVSGVVGDDLWFNVHFRPRYVYLPTVLRHYDARPDLLVETIAIDPADPQALQIRITNVGHSPARGFWVDLYFDPSAPPAANTPWPDLCALYGATWQVAELPAGESLTLAIGDAFYESEYSRWPTESYPGGEHALWAYADSWSNQPWGWIGESNEDNNRYGPVSFTAPESLHKPLRALDVPPRPLVP